MKHESVVSSTIESVAHDPDTNTLEVKFKRGTTYRYVGVPSDLHSDMMQASSVGKFMNDHIKGVYPHEQV